MPISTLLTRTVTITRRTASASIDSYGNPLSDEVELVTVGELQQRQRSEKGDAGELSDTGWLLILPAGTDLDSGDAVAVDGESYELVGDPWAARNPRTGLDSHVEATLRRTA